MLIQRTAKGFLAVGSGLMLLLTGCATTYYKVWDPVSRNAYYTERIDTSHSGAIKLQDARTGNTVTLQNSEVKEISKESYKEGLAAPVQPLNAAPATTQPALPAAKQEAAPAAAPAPTAPSPAPADTSAPESGAAK